MKLTWNKIIVFLLEVYIVISFFVYHNTTIESIFLLGLTIIYIFGKQASVNGILLQKDILSGTIIVVLCVIGALIFSQYSQAYTVGAFVCLLLLVLLLKNNAFEYVGEEKFDYFYLILLFSVTWEMISSYRGGSIKVYTLMGDQNYTGILVFCLFLYANKKKYISGIIITCVYALIFSNSRSFFFLLVLFYIFLFTKKYVYRFINNKKNTLFVIFILSGVLVSIFSVVWVYKISAETYTVYKASLNDSSNRIRFLSILNGLQMLVNPKETFLWGYGSKLLEVMGISGSDFIHHPRFMGLRLTQPHNTIINMMVRMGVVPAIVYFYILSSVLKKRIDEDNIPYFFPFFINAMFMHSLLCFQWLALLTIILALPQKEWRQWKWRMKRRGIVNRQFSTSYPN